MSGIGMNFSNTFKFMAAISPLLLGFLLVVTSIINQDIKGVIYIAGVLIAAIITIFIANIFKSQPLLDRAVTCDMFDLPFARYNVPAFNSMFIAFTLWYLYLPMYNNDSDVNYVLVAFLVVLFIIDAATKLWDKCTTVMGIVFGGILGSLFGVAWYLIINQSGNDDLLYFTDINSGGQQCSKSNKTTFRCSVYKNGELIRSDD